MIPILHNYFQRVKAEGTLPNSFCNASITLIPKLDKDIISKESYRPIYLMNIDIKMLKKY